MDIYNSRYFIINKRFLITFGMWPYQNYYQKLFLRSLVAIVVILIILTQMLRVHFCLKTDLDIIMEHFMISTFFSSIFIKLLTTIIHEKKLERLYINIVKNWQIIENKDERKVLIDYSEKGRTITIFYIAYIFSTILIFISVPTALLVLNNIKSFNVSLERIFLLGGELFVDRDKYYMEIFIFDLVCIIICAPLMCAFDCMYFVCVQQCLGLFAIIKFRLRKCTESHTNQNLSKSEKESNTYKYIIRTIQLHKNVLTLSSFDFINTVTEYTFTDILEATYSSTFLILVGLNMLMNSFLCVLVLATMDEFMKVLRFGFVLIGSILHLFILSWPGQALSDHSISLSDDAYANKWYESSIESQRSLKFLILRCIKPCQLTAGGIYVMNYSNFAMIMKTSVSYITMFTSLR